MRKIMLITVVLACVSGCLPVSGQTTIRIAAASDVKFALDSVASLFERRQTVRLSITYGSSGKLFEQLSNGAPFDIFFSADVNYPESLREKGLLLGEPKIYGTGRIVLWSRTIDVESRKMASLTEPTVRRVAIANPLHAPYGQRAVEALKHYRIHDAVSQRLVYGENISQAAQFAYSGAADIGIISLSLALSPQIQKINPRYYLIPENAHQPLTQAFAIMKRSSARDSVKAFTDFLDTAEAKTVFVRYGFAVPSTNREE